MGMDVKMVSRIQTTTTMVSQTTLMPVLWMQEQVRSVQSSVAAITIQMDTATQSMCSRQSRRSGSTRMVTDMAIILMVSRQMDVLIKRDNRRKTPLDVRIRMVMAGPTSTMLSRTRPPNIPMRMVTGLEMPRMGIKATTVSVFPVHQQRTFSDAWIQTLMDGRI